MKTNAPNATKPTEPIGADTAAIEVRRGEGLIRPELARRRSEPDGCDNQEREERWERASDSPFLFLEALTEEIPSNYALANSRRSLSCAGDLAGRTTLAREGAPVN